MIQGQLLLISESLNKTQVLAWSGGLEIGVTKCNPESIEIPANATDLKNGTWVTDFLLVFRVCL